MRDWNKDGKLDSEDRYLDYKNKTSGSGNRTGYSKHTSHNNDEDRKIYFHPENILPMIIIAVVIMVPVSLLQSCLMG